MGKIKLGELFVGDGEPPYIIAELASNHNGDMELAKRLIKASKGAGADCVKFQSWTKESIFSRVKYQENCFLADDYRNRSDYSLEQIVEAYSISDQQLLEMKKYADDQGIAIASTPFSEKEADFLVDSLHAPFIKVASMDLNNLPFLEYLATKGRPMIVSTGMGTLSEIDNAVRTIEQAGCKQIVLLHCVAEYPPDDNLVHLRKINTLKMQYPDYPIGFSDHTLGTAIPIAAIALGATVIEKHITLDKTMQGWDHKASATPDELASIVDAAKRIPIAMGSSRICLVESEERREEFRRGAVAVRELKAGHVLIPGDIAFKRPARGIHPDEVGYILGRALKRTLGSDDILRWQDIV